MEKTSQEWFLDLKPEHREKATRLKPLTAEGFLYAHLRVALYSMNWSKSEEGTAYWMKIWSEMALGTY